MRKVMLDTNVIVDYLMGREPGCSECARIIDMHAAGEHVVCVSVLTLKDVYYLVSMHLKRMEREAGNGLDEAMARAANEVAWSCVRFIVETIHVVSAGRGDALQALAFKAVHGDFEDNLVAASAQSARVDHLVSNDEKLIRHAPVSCLSSADAVALLESELAR